MSTKQMFNKGVDIIDRLDDIYTHYEELGGDDSTIYLGLEGLIYSIDQACVSIYEDDFEDEGN